MSTLLPILFFILGLVFGSFFNVVGLRVPKNEPFANERSQCPVCHHPLAWYELIPVLSYVLQRGKCRSCKTTISRLYPVVELATGFLFAYSYVRIGLELELITSLLFVSLLMIVFVTDVTTMLIPNKILLFFLPLFIIMRLVVPLDPWWSPALGFVLGLLIVFVIIFISRGGMGGGDMKLLAVLGIVLGYKHVVLTFFLASLFGAVIGIILILLKRVDRKQPIPFGPYVVLGALIAYFHGTELLTWYLSLFS